VVADVLTAVGDDGTRHKWRTLPDDDRMRRECDGMRATDVSGGPKVERECRRCYFDGKLRLV